MIPSVAESLRTINRWRIEYPLRRLCLGASKTSILPSVQLLTACLESHLDTSIGCAWTLEDWVYLAAAPRDWTDPT